MATWQKAALILVALIVVYLIVGFLLGYTYSTSSVKKAEGADCTPTTTLTLSASESGGPVSGDLVNSDCSTENVHGWVVSSDPHGVQTTSGGPMVCDDDDWTLTGSIAGVETDTFSVQESFVLQPYSNITDWQDPPFTSHTFTAFGATYFDDQGTSAFVYPTAQFSPNIYSQLAVHAEANLAYPRVGSVKLRTWNITLRANVTSPGYTPATDLCTGEWTVEAHDIFSDIGGGVGGAAQDGLSWALSHASCWWGCD